MIFKMRNIAFGLCVMFSILLFSCRKEEVPVNFEDLDELSIFDYLKEHEAQYSSFMSILKSCGYDKTLMAYNPERSGGYTLFLPDNNAIDRFIDSRDDFDDLQDLLDDENYTRDLAGFHIVIAAYQTNDFPFGALPEPTFSEDYLTVSFVVDPDSAYYSMNNQAAIVQSDIELSNGYVHLLKEVLVPVSYTTYDWIGMDPQFSIFLEAINLTGLGALIDVNLKEDDHLLPSTLLIEPDSIFNLSKVYTLDDLVKRISPDQDNYTEVNNPLYNFMAYHVLQGSNYLNDFEGLVSNYNTNGDVPLRIDGLGLDIKINKGKEVYDTVVYEGDTIFVDYVGFQYDFSNVTTQSGAIHIIDRLMDIQTPSRSNRTFQFYEDPLIYSLRNDLGIHEINDPELSDLLDWRGGDLLYVKQVESWSNAWGGDYLEISGDFTISYIIPKIVQGKYEVFLGAESYSNQNAIVTVYIDGKKVGGYSDLSLGGNSNNPFQGRNIGVLDISKYEEHLVEIRPIVPGRFLWDYIRFEPI